ncbi:MAG TPA: peptidoglycan-binding domain-containing protein [Actinoplanes sp.]|nr:peptidoglycan-binding domain-containing protein [Actinoplanes sp.]
MTRRRTWGIAAALTAGAVGAAAVVAGLPEAEGSSATADAMPPATAQVARETLVDTQTHNGDLGYGETTALAARASGTVTALAAEGTTVTRGRALYRIDDDPVVLLYGKLPAYRRLGPGSDGADVAQLERNLRALGYDGFTVDDEYTGATADAVRDWQDDLGVPETGRVDPAQVVYAAGAVRVGSRTAAVGEVVQPGKDLLSLTGTAPVATVELGLDDQRLARVGASVEVTLPDGSTTPAKITRTETAVQEAQGPGEEDTTTIDVTVAFPSGKAPAGLDQASVDVAFTVAERKDVLTVPVAALLALAEGGYGVEVVDGTTTRIVAVETGLFATGKVEVSGPGLREGTVVGVPS